MYGRCSTRPWSARHGARLSVRRLLEIEGPYGFGLKSVPLDDRTVSEGVATSPCLPLAWLTTSFMLGKRDLAGYEYAGVPPNLGKLAEAAITAARREDDVLLNGAGGSPGLMNYPGAGKSPLGKWDKIGGAANDLIGAVTALDAEGFHGPYILGLSPRRYNLLFRRYEMGGTELEHLSQMVRSIVKLPALEDGGVLIAEGRQYAAIVMGQDLSLGFVGPDGRRPRVLHLGEPGPPGAGAAGDPRPRLNASPSSFSSPPARFRNILIRPGVLRITNTMTLYRLSCLLAGLILVLAALAAPVLGQGEIGFVRVASSPGGALVYIDDVYRGTTPTSGTDPAIEVTANVQHTLRLTKRATRTTRPRSRSPPASSATSRRRWWRSPTTSTFGTIGVASTPGGAEVYIDGTYYGITPTQAARS